MSFQLIQTITLTGVSSNITFQNIPQDGTDLMIILNAQTNSANLTTDDLAIRPNDLTTSQTSLRLEGTGTGVTSATRTLLTANNEIPSVTYGFWGNGLIYFFDYASTTNNKVIDYVSAGETDTTTGGSINLLAGNWASNAAITSIGLRLTVNSFQTGSTASLYKITKP